MSGVFDLTEMSMINDMQRMTTISNNLANVNTPGFKREISVSKTFDNVLLQQSTLNNSTVDQLSSQLNASVKTETVIDQAAGVFKHTGNSFDVAIEGEGFLEVSGKGGSFYTRHGAMSLDATGTLVNTNGYTIQGLSGDIRITTQEPKIDKQGVVWDGETQVGQLKVVQFSDPRKLLKVGGGLFRADGIKSTPLLGDDIRIRQGYLETSNVSQMNEMVQMIELMRHFETSQKLLKSYDELMDNAIRTLGEY